MSSEDFSRPSKKDFELSRGQVRKYDKGHTWWNQNYTWFPQNKTRKFIYDVNKEIELQNALKEANDPALTERAAQLEGKLRDPYRGYYPNTFMSSNGYHDRAKHVKERNAIIADAKSFSAYDKGKFGGIKQAYTQVDPFIYARSRVQNSKNSYRDLVRHAATLPEDERKKLFKKFEDTVANKSLSQWLLNPIVDYQTPQDYKNLTNK